MPPLALGGLQLGRFIQGVAHVSRKDVKMVMPHILIPGGFVVLTGGHAVASVNGLERDRHNFCEPMYSVRQMEGKRVDILDVQRGNDQDVARIIRSPVAAQKTEDLFVIPVHHLCLAVFIFSTQDSAERTDIPFGTVGVNKSSVTGKERSAAAAFSRNGIPGLSRRLTESLGDPSQTVPKGPDRNAGGVLKDWIPEQVGPVVGNQVFGS